MPSINTPSPIVAFPPETLAFLFFTKAFGEVVEQTRPAATTCRSGTRQDNHNKELHHMSHLNRMIVTGVCVGLVASIAGCASVPADPDLQRTFVPVQAHQTKDLNLTCPDLQEQIGDMESGVAVLDKQIKHDKEQSQTFALAAAFSSFSGAMANNPLSAQLASANANLGNAGASMSDQQAMTKEQLRANIEARHDALIQIYFARQCKAG
jgi:hypothetical protein